MPDLTGLDDAIGRGLNGLRDALEIVTRDQHALETFPGLQQTADQLTGVLVIANRLRPLREGVAARAGHRPPAEPVDRPRSLDRMVAYQMMVPEVNADRIEAERLAAAVRHAALDDQGG